MTDGLRRTPLRPYLNVKTTVKQYDTNYCIKHLNSESSDFIEIIGFSSVSEVQDPSLKFFLPSVLCVGSCFVNKVEIVI